MSSKVKWPERFPMHWQLVPAKWLFPESKKRAAEEDEQLSATQDYGVISQAKFMELAGRRVVQLNHNQHLRKRVEVDDFVISMRSFQGGLERAWAAGGIRSSYVILKPKPTLLLGYYQYLFKSSVYIQALQSTANFIRDGQDMSYQDFILIDLPLPPNEEQQVIAAFLDYETTRIDRLIAQQQRLIELLKEKRQAVISHAVTKGLNPDAPMKDSGIEWLGDVPAHWNRTKLKHITHQIVDAEHKTAPYFDDGEYLVCRTTNVRDGKLRLDGGKYTNSETYEEWTERGKPEAGDILFTREAPAGEACVYDGEIPLCLGQRMVLFKLDQSRFSPEFVLHSIYSGLADDFVKQLSQGSTVVHFNMADIQNIPLFEPSLDEQELLVEHLSKELAMYDNLTSSAFKAIAFMQERRTALISAAVTGKIDLRGWTQPTEEVAA